MQCHERCAEPGALRDALLATSNIKADPLHRVTTILVVFNGKSLADVAVADHPELLLAIDDCALQSHKAIWIDKLPRQLRFRARTPRRFP